ncbi:hypothetical protein LTR62_007270 [Meristemomyces frigidus]|uniref:Uncharacterized protein n=1 Tax=Meristemomyces frigidus TaxID=1508187 RepID=A0AAN7TBP5_9PEZI|nr:hypothetical protein LTR62_007270 [Meristemomyces frigidus]
MAIAKPSARPTPPRENDGNNTYVNYVPHDLAYSRDFEDELLQAVLHPTNTDPGLRIIPLDSTEQPENGISVRVSDISIAGLPSVTEDELPLLLSDARRVFQSSIPGVKLTHPGGYLEGGPGLDPNMDTFADDFLHTHRRSNAGDVATLRTALDREVSSSIEELKQRLRAREQARWKNEQIEKELRGLEEEHDMELKIHNKMAENMQRKREAKEKRRKEREEKKEGG